MSFATARVAPEKAVFRPVLPLAPMPGMTEMQMATMTYREQLLHPNWQRKRLEILQRDDFHCQCCYDSDSTLHVHHKRYVKGRMAWEYPNDELVTLCEGCHGVVHEQEGAFRELMAKLPVDGPGCISNAMGLLAGWATGHQGMNFSTVFQEEPFHFVLGQIASSMMWKLNMQGLMRLLEAVEAAPPWVARDAMEVFVSACLERRNEPPSAEEVMRMAAAEDF